MKLIKIGKVKTKKINKYFEKQLKQMSINNSGKNNPNAKSIIINKIKYNTKKEACKKLNLSLYKLNKLI